MIESFISTFQGKDIQVFITGSIQYHSIITNLYVDYAVSLKQITQVLDEILNKSWIETLIAENIDDPIKTGVLLTLQNQTGDNTIVDAKTLMGFIVCLAQLKGNDLAQKQKFFLLARTLESDMDNNTKTKVQQMLESTAVSVSSMVFDINVDENGVPLNTVGDPSQVRYMILYNAKNGSGRLQCVSFQDYVLDYVTAQRKFVSGDMIIDKTIMGAQIADNTITGDKLINNTLSDTQIQLKGITNASLADATITNAQLAVGAVGTTQIQANAVTSTQIADNSITANKIPDNSVAGAKLINNTLSDTQIQLKGITNASLADATITNAQLAVGAVGTTQIQANAVTNVQLADNSTTANKIPDNSVAGAKLINNTLSDTQIQLKGITRASLADATITSTQLAANSVTNAQIAINSVSSSLILNGAVTTSKIANNAVSYANVGTDIKSEFIAHETQSLHNTDTAQTTMVTQGKPFCYYEMSTGINSVTSMLAIAASSYLCSSSTILQQDQTTPSNSYLPFDHSNILMQGAYCGCHGMHNYNSKLQTPLFLGFSGDRCLSVGAKDTIHSFSTSLQPSVSSAHVSFDGTLHNDCDAELKYNIRPKQNYQEQLEKLMNLEIVTYSYGKRCEEALDKCKERLAVCTTEEERTKLTKDLGELQEIDAHTILGYTYQNLEDCGFHYALTNRRLMDDEYAKSRGIDRSQVHQRIRNKTRKTMSHVSMLPYAIMGIKALKANHDKLRADHEELKTLVNELISRK